MRRATKRKQRLLIIRINHILKHGDSLIIEYFISECQFDFESGVQQSERRGVGKEKAGPMALGF